MDKELRDVATHRKRRGLVRLMVLAGLIVVLLGISALVTAAITMTHLLRTSFGDQGVAAVADLTCLHYIESFLATGRLDVAKRRLASLISAKKHQVAGSLVTCYESDRQKIEKALAIHQIDITEVLKKYQQISVFPSQTKQQ